MKAMNVNNVTHCTDDNYRLITIQGAGEMLIYIVPSYSLSGLLNKQKGKMLGVVISNGIISDEVFTCPYD